MDLEEKLDFLCEAIVRLESKLDAVIGKQNTIPEPTSSDHERPEKRQKDIWLEERLRVMKKNP